MMEEKGKIAKTVLGVLALIVIVVGNTYAIFSWASNPNRGYISGGTEGCFDITYTKGTDITNGLLSFGNTYSDGLPTTVKVKTSETCSTTGNGILYLDTKEETSDYLITNNLIRYQVVDGGEEATSGVVSSKGKNVIYDNFEVTNTEKEITVYLWISGNDVTDENISEISSSTYSGGISMSVERR